MLAAFLLTLAASPDLSAWRWEEVVAGGTPPAVRRDAALVFDRARDRLLLFAGDGPGGEYADTHALDLGSLSWSELATASPVFPPARFSLVAGLDEARDRLVITTGQGGATFFNDVWALDLAAESWTELTPPSAPPAARYGSAGGLYPGAGLLYLTHGFTTAGRFEDTWALDLTSDDWREVTPPAPRPLPRCLHAAAMIDADALVLFGGCASGFGPCPLDDLWWLDGGSSPAWTDLSLAGGPSARTFPAMVAVADSGAVAVFGGSGGGRQNDLWLYDTQAPGWQAASPTGTPPPPRDGHAMVWRDGAAAGCGALYVFGGQGTAGHLQDVWRLVPPPAGADPAVRIGRAGASVLLRWAHQPGSVTYEVWRHDAPDFQPGDPMATLLTGPIAIDGGTASYTDTPPPAGALYYRVRAIDCP